MPAVKFASTDGSAFTSSSVVSTTGNKFTAFFVYTQDNFDANQWSSLVLNGSGNGWAYQKSGASGSPNSRTYTIPSVVDSFGGSTVATPEIVCITHNGTATMAMYLNGATVSLSTSTGAISTPTTQLTIGASWNGYVGEIIVFDGVLKTEERGSVEAYLSKKWAIKVS